MQLVTTDSIFTNYLYIDSVSPTTPNATSADGQKLPKNPIADPACAKPWTTPSIAPPSPTAPCKAAPPPPARSPPPASSATWHPRPRHLRPAPRQKAPRRSRIPQGFNLALSCTNDRFAGDVRTCQAVAQMLNAIGIRPAIEALPMAIYARRWATYGPEGSSDFTATISMFGSTSGLASEGMNTILRTANPERGLGASNRRFVSDPHMDELLATVDATFDDQAREQNIEKAVRYAMDRRLVLPLFFVKASWGLRKDLVLIPRADQYTLAMTVRRTK